MVDLLYSTTSSPGLPLGLLCCAGAGLHLMRASPRLIAVALATAAGSAALFALTISADPFAIFADAYLTGACLVVPAVPPITSVWWSQGRRAGLGAVLWALAVGGTHFWFVAVASASV